MAGLVFTHFLERRENLDTPYGRVYIFAFIIHRHFVNDEQATTEHIVCFQNENCKLKQSEGLKVGFEMCV